MKKVFLLLFMFCIYLSISSVVMASDLNGPSVKLDGEYIDFFDVPAKNINGRVMVPLRKIFETLGSTVNWEQKTRTVSANKDNIKINITIDDNIAYVNENKITLDSPAIIINGRTLVPVRFISESFGNVVKWDGDTNTVLIFSQNKIFFKDKILEKNILKDIINIKDVLTSEVAQNVVSLSLHIDEAKSLDDLKHFINLKELKIYSSNIEDIKPLRNLVNLNKLTLKLDKVNDISSLSKLTNLNFLSIECSQLQYIYPISKLTTLETFLIKKTNVKDLDTISSIVNLKYIGLEKVNLSQQNMSFFSNIETLEALSINGCVLTNSSFLKKMNSLKGLDISNNKIKDISTLSNLVNLEKLMIENNLIENLNPLATLINLTNITYKSNPVIEYDKLETSSNEVLKNLYNSLNSHKNNQVSVPNKYYDYTTPLGWVKDESIDVDKLENILALDNYIAENYSVSIAAFVKPNSINTLDDVVYNFKKDLSEDISVHDFTIDGLSSKLIVYDSKEKQHIIATNKDDVYYLIYFKTETSSYYKYLPIFESFVNTIKFKSVD